MDLVGHGWGGLLVLRVVTAHGACPCAAGWSTTPVLSIPDFAVSDMERTWQTPGAGERWMSAVRAAPPTSPGGAAGRLALLGVPSPQAAAIGAALDETMSRCVLDLARSAIPNARSGWPARRPCRTAPASLSWPAPTRSTRAACAQQVACDLRAQLRRLDGLGHYWMAEAPERAAGVLTEFWSSLKP